MSEYIKRHGSIMQDATENGITPPDWVDKNTIKHGSGMPEYEPEPKVNILECSTPHQYLVTDGSGVAKWEDKPFGEKMEEVVVVPEVVFPPSESGQSVQSVVPNYPLKVGQTYRVFVDENDYEVEATESDGGVGFDIVTEAFRVIVDCHPLGIECMVGFASNDPTVNTMEHTVEILTTEKTIKTIDPKYLPGGGLVKTAIIKGDHYDSYVSWRKDFVEIGPTAPTFDLDAYRNNGDTFHCVNMTHEEALNSIYSGGVVEFVLMMYDSSPVVYRTNFVAYHDYEYESPIEGEGTLTRAIEGMTNEGHAVVWGREGIFVVSP